MAFRDRYTDFSFNEVTSKQMNVWITNSMDLQMRLTPEFSDTFVSPTYSNSQILTGTSITKSDFSLKCIAIDVTMQDWRAIQNWLSPTKVGRLQFDFNDMTYYNAKVGGPITGTNFIKGKFDNILGDLYIVEFTVNFVTVGDFAALGILNTGLINSDIENDCVEGYYVENFEEHVRNIKEDKLPSYEVQGNKIVISFFTVDETNNEIIVKREITNLDEKINLFSYYNFSKIECDFKYTESPPPECVGVKIHYSCPRKSVEAVSSNKYCMPCVVENTGMEFEFPDSNTKDQVKSIKLLSNNIKVTLKGTIESNPTLFSLFSVQSINEDKDIKKIYDVGLNYDKETKKNKLVMIPYNITKDDPADEGLRYYTDFKGDVAEIEVFEDNMYILPLLTNGDNIDIKINDDFNYLINNVGSYEMYPNLYLKPVENKVSLSINNTKYYSYSYSVSSPLPININGQTGFNSCNGTLVENAKYTANTEGNLISQSIVSNSYNKGQCSIESGLPELVPIEILSSVEDLEQVEIAKEKRDVNLKVLTFRPLVSFKYDRNNTYFIHLFRGLSKSAEYNNGAYPRFPLYSEGAEPYFSEIKDSRLCRNTSICLINKKEDIWRMVGTKEELDGLTQGQQLYLSICNTNLANIEGNGFIYLQTRDVL